jgi:hypothetical protein
MKSDDLTYEQISKIRWLTVKEAMLYSRVNNRKTIINWISKGLIYGHKRTGSWIIDRESIDKWYSEDSIEQARPTKAESKKRSTSYREVGNENLLHRLRRSQR